MKIFEIIGWVGAILLLLSFSLASFGIINANEILYPLFNFIGSAGLAISSLKKKDFQPGFLNIVWAIVAFLSLSKIILSI